ncbi:MAG: ParB/RepB/Spo0J family partition protein [Microbacterium sp.]
MTKELISKHEGRGNTFRVLPEDVTIVGLDTKDGPEHPLYDERIGLPIDESMVLSIMAHGVLQVVKVAVYDGVPYVVDGRQRVRAARIANERLKAGGEPLVSLRVEGENGRKISDNRLLTAMVAMNEIRQTDDVLVKAGKAERMSARGMTTAEIATAFGVTPQCVRDWAKLAGLAPQVKRAVRDGRISAHAAANLSELSAEEQVRKLEEILASGAKPTAQNVRNRVQNTESPKPSGRIIRRLLEVENVDLPEGFLLALRWQRGEIPTTRIKGLSAALKNLEKQPKAGA